MSILSSAELSIKKKSFITSGPDPHIAGEVKTMVLISCVVTERVKVKMVDR